MLLPSKRPQRWRFRLVFQRIPLRNPGRCSNCPKWRREREVLEVKPVPVSIIPPQSPHTLAWDWSPSIPGEMTRPASTLLLHCPYEQKKKIGPSGFLRTCNVAHYWGTIKEHWQCPRQQWEWCWWILKSSGTWRRVGCSYWRFGRITCLYCQGPEGSIFEKIRRLLHQPASPKRT